MKVALVIIVGTALAIATNLVSNIIAPHVATKRKLVAVSTVFLVALSIGFTQFPETNDLPSISQSRSVPTPVAALQVGEVWRSNKVEITLKSLSAINAESKDKLFGEWKIKNISGQSVPIRLGTSSFSASDSQGNALRVIGLGAQYRSPTSDLELVLGPSDEFDFWLAIEYDFYYSSARTVTVVFHNTLTTENAAWRTRVGFQ